MVGSWRLKCLTFPAPPPTRVLAISSPQVFFSIGSIGERPVLWHVARVCSACSQVANPHTKYQQIELNELWTGERRGLEGEEKYLRGICQEKNQKNH